MANTILLKRGVDANRTSITPAQGEPIWVTDTQLLYVGDGATAGGIPVGAVTISGNAGDASGLVTSTETLNIDGGDGITTTLTASTNTLELNYTGITDTTTLVKGSADDTKELRFEVDGITTGTTRVITMADQNIDLTPGSGTYASAGHNHSGTYSEAAFKTLTVSGQSDVVADAIDDTLTFAAGSGISITTNATTDTITITNSLATNPWTIDSDSGTEVVAGGTTVTFTGGTAISSDYNTTTDTLTYTLDIGTGSTQVAAGDHNHDADYVNVDGDTMTGNLTFNDSVVVNLGTGLDVKHHFNGTAYITELESVNWIVRDNADAAIMTITEADKSVSLGGDLTIAGDLTVSGSVTTVNTETINLADNIITLNSNETGTASQNAGIEVERGTDANATLRWNETSDVWEIDGGSSTNGAVGTFYEIATSDTIADLDLSGTYLAIADVDDTPVNGATTSAISSNWAYGHENAADPHSQYPLAAGTESITGTWSFTNATFDGGTF